MGLYLTSFDYSRIKVHKIVRQYYEQLRWAPVILFDPLLQIDAPDDTETNTNPDEKIITIVY